ncbi:IgGFc-binding protein [Apibacter raozihei]|uniref:IgGFc-binding protein n=1 Tax=Apibacter raozihei TaxID=2500547 RepID=UPI000FE3EDE7|nr:IgGFc-binding protein [Apibacter raozihei]
MNVKAILKNSKINFYIFLLSVNVQAQNTNRCDLINEEFATVFSGSNSLRDAGGVEEIIMNDKLHIQGVPGSNILIGSKEYTIPDSGYLLVTEKFPIATHEYSDKIVKIKSDNPNTFIRVERNNPYSNSSFTLIPKSMWGKDYLVPGYPDQSKKYKVQSFIDIFSINKKKTQVTIKDSNGAIVEKISLKAGQNYEFNSIEDLTGYSVEASDIVGVISGNHCLRISAACDHTALMLKDNTHLDKKFYNPGSSFFSSTTIHRIVASKNQTTVQIDKSQTKTLNKGEFYQYTHENPHTIESSSPVLAYSIFDKRALGSPEYSLDPSIYFIPSENQAVNLAQFSFPEYMIYSKDIKVIMRSDMTDYLLLDNTPLSVDWKTFSADTSLSTATLELSDLHLHTLSVSNKKAYFIPIMMARGWDVSLASLIKDGFTNLKSGENPPCPLLIHNGMNAWEHKNAEIQEIRPKDIILNDFHQPIIVEKEEIELLVFDNAEEDGDIISVYLNDQLVYPDVNVLKSGTILKFTLEKGKNNIIIKAENEGRIYPNTAGLTFDDGTTRQTIILHNRKGQSKNLTIISK